MKNVIFSGKEFKVNANKFKETKEGYKNSILFEIVDNEESIGKVVLSEPVQNKFIKDSKGEIEMVSMAVNPSYKNEGVESLLFDVIIDYVTALDRILMVFDFSKSYSEGFFERRGFKFEPVVYHQTTYVLGKNYGYNLENIEEEVHSFLHKSGEEDSNGDDLKMAYIKMIVEMNNALTEAGESPMVSFSFKDVEISDPFVDESGMSAVSPIKYYGKEFLDSAFWNPLLDTKENNRKMYQPGNSIEFDIEEAIEQLTSESGLLGLLESIFQGL